MVGDGLRAQLFGFDIQHRVDGVLLLYPEIIEFIGIPDEHGMEAFLSGEGVVHLVEPMILNGRIDDGIVGAFRNEAADQMVPEQNREA